MKATETPSCACLACGEILDAATPIEKARIPRPGSISICIYCGHIMALAENMKFRELNDEEMRDVAGNKLLVEAQKIRAQLMNKKKH